MRKTFVTKMPDKAGAFLEAGRIVRKYNGNITRVNYNKALDVHTLFLEAEAEKEAAILRAEAQKEATIKEAEGQAEAILKIQQANADGIRAIKEAGADAAVLQLKSLEAFTKAADGKATKIIIPSEIQGLAGAVTAISELAKSDGVK